MPKSPRFLARRMRSCLVLSCRMCRPPFLIWRAALPRTPMLADGACSTDCSGDSRMVTNDTSSPFRRIPICAKCNSGARRSVAIFTRCTPLSDFVSWAMTRSRVASNLLRGLSLSIALFAWLRAFLKSVLLAWIGRFSRLTSVCIGMDLQFTSLLASHVAPPPMTMRSTTFGGPTTGVFSIRRG